MMVGHVIVMIVVSPGQVSSEGGAHMHDRLYHEYLKKSSGYQ